MKEALGTSVVFNLMMVFLGVIIAILIGSVAYSKGFKVRNRIIDIIEKNNGYNEQAAIDIANDLKKLGYRVTDNKDCASRDGNYGIKNDEYNYCIYTYSTSKGDYFGVTVFIQLDLPLIGKYINLPVYGETRVMIDRDILIG